MGLESHLYIFLFCRDRSLEMENRSLELALRDVYPTCSRLRRPAMENSGKSGQDCPELLVPQAEGQYVLCRWTDGLYYLGKIKRVSCWEVSSLPFIEKLDILQLFFFFLTFWAHNINNQFQDNDLLYHKLFHV